MEPPNYSELVQPTPREIQRRWHTFDGEVDPNFDPWRGWNVSWKVLVSGIILMLVGWACYQFSFLEIAIFPAIFGTMLTVVGILLCFSGLVSAHQEINGHRFLVSKGAVAVATVTEKVGNDSHRWDYKFEFCTDSGRKIKGYCYLTRLGSRHFQQLGAEQTFIVLYSAKRPKHHIAYETAIYRAVMPETNETK